MVNNQRPHTTPLRSRSNGRHFNPGHHVHCVIHVWILARSKQMKEMSEAAFLQQVKALAYMYDWSFHHSTPSMTSKGRWITTGSPGFPDICLAHRTRGVIFAELKTSKGKTTPAQNDWLERLSPHAECYLWRPLDIDFIAERLASC